MTQNPDEAGIVMVQHEPEELTSVRTGKESFIFMESTTKAIEVALKTEQNLVLYGKGGYGKSEFLLELLRDLGIEPYVITMGTGMTTDRLFGGFDIKTFNESGKMEYLVDNSFMNHEYVIFEELFDAPDFILEQLKDILSAKVFRNGSQVFPIRTKLIFCATNKTRGEFSKNNSLKALMERFPLEHNVKWETHTREDYEQLFMTKLGYSDPLLTYVLAAYDEAGHTVSPRIALSAAEVLEACGLDCLQFIADFGTQPDLLKQCLAKFESIIKLDRMIDEATKSIADLSAIQHFDPLTGLASEIGRYKRLNVSLTQIVNQLENMIVDDTQINAKTDIIKKIRRTTSDATAVLELLV